MKMAIRVYLANDHDVIREGLKNIFSKNPVFNICGEYNGNIDTINYIEKVRPSLLFFDVSSSDNIILKNLSRLRVTCPRIMIIAIIHSNEYDCYHDITSIEEISGFFNTSFRIDELIKGISAVLSNKRYIQESIMKLMNSVNMDKKTDRYKINSLTKRELEVLIQVANGMLNKEIATCLNISERTVKNHLSSIFKKLEIYDRTQAAVFAIKNAIVK